MTARQKVTPNPASNRKPSAASPLSFVVPNTDGVDVGLSAAGEGAIVSVGVGSGVRVWVGNGLDIGRGVDVDIGAV